MFYACFESKIKKSSLIYVRILDQLPSAESQCQIRSKLPLDMIYTDIVGLTQFKKKVRQGYGKFRSVKFFA